MSRLTVPACSVCWPASSPTWTGLAGFPPIAEEETKKRSAEARRVRHRQRLAEPDPPPKRLTVREERAALRALLDLPPSEKG